MLKDRPVARVRLDYRILDETRNEVVAEGYTIHSFVHADTGRPTRAPAHFLEVVEQALQRPPTEGSVMLGVDDGRIVRAVETALLEDIGVGDVTGNATVPEEQQGEGGLPLQS